MTSWSRNLPLM